MFCLVNIAKIYKRSLFPKELRRTYLDSCGVVELEGFRLSVFQIHFQDIGQKEKRVSLVE